MSKIKSYEQFVNENLFGQYSYYGAGSLFPIVQKLASEGKNPEQIYLFLTTIGVDEERKINVLKKVFLNESIDVDSLTEASRSKFKGKTAHDLYTQLNGKSAEVFIKNEWYSVDPKELKAEKGTSFTGYTHDGSDYEFDVSDIDFIQESVNEGNAFADKHAKVIVNDEWVDPEDFKTSWDITKFREYVDNKLDQYNSEELKNNVKFDNSKGDVLIAIEKLLQAKFGSKFPFLNEGGLYEEDDILKADTKDLAKGISPDKAKADDEVKNAIDKLKNDDKEKKDAEEKPEGEGSDDTAKIDALKDALKDAQKMEKIKKILSESMGFDMTGLEDEVLESVLEYHTVLEKLSQAEKDKLKPTDFVFPDRKSWPIHDEKHAKTALVWATWPQYADLKKQVVASVIKRYPNLKGVGAAK